MKHSPRLLAIAALILTLSSEGRAEDWPHWRGPDRSAITGEPSGWQPGDWPPAPPLWKTNAGEGAAAPLVVGEHLYLFGWNDDKDAVRCVESATGKPLWEQHYAAPQYGRHSVGDKGMYRGATATPEFDPECGLLFTLGCDGDLNAWDTRAGGKNVWSLNLYQSFDVPRRPQITERRNTLRDYGYTTAPLVFGDTVIVEAGDPKGGCLKAFDKRTGALRWESENRDPAGHSGGLALMTIENVPCIAVVTSWNVLVARLDGAEAGKTVAEYEWKTDFSNTIAGVAVDGTNLLVSSRYNQMAMARISVSLRDAREVWRNRHPTGVCTPVIHQGKIYFANRGVHCVDLETGELDWVGGKIGDAGSCLVTADDRLVVWGNGGDLSLVEIFARSPKKCTILAERPRIFDDMAWPHVVIADGRLFCKVLSGEMACFSLPPPDAAP